MEPFTPGSRQDRVSLDHAFGDDHGAHMIEPVRLCLSRGRVGVRSDPCFELVGVMDPMRGELPMAFVELKEGAAFDEKAVLKWCRERLAGYKVPDEIRVLESLPRNPTGKVLRLELKALL